MSKYTDYIQSQILIYILDLDFKKNKRGVFVKSPTRKLKKAFSEDGIPVTSFMIGQELRKMGGVTKSTTLNKKTYNGIEFDKDSSVYKVLIGGDCNE